MRRHLAVSMLLCVPSLVLGAEGMWTLDKLPQTALKDNYGFEPDAAWIDTAMKASVRLASGCSGSFVSADGLVLTNNHCVVGCVQGLSSEQHDYLNQGFLAHQREAELQCPATELNRLEAIADVTERIRKATDGLQSQAYREAKDAEKSRIESECGDDPRTRCDVVELYNGGRYHLYRYYRYQDVRLVFAPEYDIGFFGGDPDNFQFPRYNLDAAFLRAYENGKPARVAHWFPISTNGVEPGELTLVTGHPGRTSRLLTVAQLERLRDLDLFEQLQHMAELRGLLTRYRAEGPEQARQAQGDLTFLENSIKVYTGQFKALQSRPRMQSKRQAEAALQKAANVEERDAWQIIADAQQTYAAMRAPYVLIERGDGFRSQYFQIARTLVRGAEERDKPNDERLREFQDAGLTSLQQKLFSPAPVYPAYEKVKLGWSLAKLREKLGPDDAFVKLVLGKDAPDALAARLVQGTALGDVAERKRLWEGGSAAIAASKDPFIELARAIDTPARAIRRKFEDEVKSVEEKQAEIIAAVRFRELGTGVYPDATFTLRLSYGDVRGWDEGERRIEPFTTIDGLYRRQTGAPPFRISPRWAEREAQVDKSTPFNFVTTNDIIGGNSGSPVLNRDGRLIGLAFDGNIHSLGGSFWFDEAINRCIAVDSRAIVESLRQVYRAEALVKEIVPTAPDDPPDP